MRRSTITALGTILGLSLGSVACSAPASDAAEAPPLEGEVTPEALVDRWIEAAGGMESYWALESAQYTVTTELYDTATGRLKRTRPRYVTLLKTDGADLTRVERWEGNDFIAQGWDGSTVWATYNGDFLAEGDKDFDEVLYVSGDLHYWMGLPFKLRDPGVNLHDQGVQDDGRHLVSVSFGEGVGLHDGDTWRYWFVEDEAWPVQLAYREEGKDNWNLLRPEDLRTVDGFTFMGRRVHFNERGQLTKVLYSHDFVLNPEIPSATFETP